MKTIFTFMSGTPEKLKKHLFSFSGLIIHNNTIKLLKYYLNRLIPYPSPPQPDCCAYLFWIRHWCRENLVSASRFTSLCCERIVASNIVVTLTRINICRIVSVVPGRFEPNQHSILLVVISTSVICLSGDFLCNRRSWIRPQFTLYQHIFKDVFPKSKITMCW